MGSKHGMWDNTVFIMVSDNGGPLLHSTNAPYRDGKGSWFECGLRVIAFVNSPLLPAKTRGTTWDGMAHSSDWYVTFAEGVAGGRLPDFTGPRSPDGFNLWNALSSNGSSPRQEVIHGVYGGDVVPPVTDEQCDACSWFAARFGDYKIVWGAPEGPHVALGVQSWPDPADEVIPFGLSGGVLEPN